MSESTFRRIAAIKSKFQKLLTVGIGVVCNSKMVSHFHLDIIQTNLYSALVWHFHFDFKKTDPTWGLSCFFVGLHGGFPAFSLAVQNGAIVGRNERKHFSTHCRYQIKIWKTLFHSNRGSLQLKNGLTFSCGLHWDKLVRSHVWHFHFDFVGWRVRCALFDALPLSNQKSETTFQL
jgi:hypothetical protein